MIVRSIQQGGARGRVAICTRRRRARSRFEGRGRCRSWMVAPVLPHAFASDSLVAWTGRGDDDADRFAGTARYRSPSTHPMRRDPSSCCRWAVSPRALACRLNGRDLGVLFASPFARRDRSAAPHRQQARGRGDQRLGERIRDLDRRGVQWKNFRDINFVGIDYKPFDASRWPVRESGLLGPVTLQPLTKMSLRSSADSRKLKRVRARDRLPGPCLARVVSTSSRRAGPTRSRPWRQAEGQETPRRRGRGCPAVM